jgi:hypothetical protein
MLLCFPNSIRCFAGFESTEEINSRSEVNTSERAASARYLLNALSETKVSELSVSWLYQSYFARILSVVANVPKMT